MWSDYPCKELEPSKGNRYPKTKFGPFWMRASRVAFYKFYGRWPEPCCLHYCDNTRCVEPYHLFEGTQTDNMQDASRKGRIRTGKKPDHIHKDRVLDLYRCGICIHQIAKHLNMGWHAVYRIVRRRVQSLNTESNNDKQD